MPDSIGQQAPCKWNLPADEEESPERKKFTQLKKL